MSLFFPIHAALLVHIVLTVFLTIYIAQSGIKEYLVRLLRLYTVLMGVWSVTMLGAISTDNDNLRGLLCSLSLVTPFLICPTALAAALYLRTFKTLSATWLLALYLPGMLLLFFSLGSPSGGFFFEKGPFGIMPHADPFALSTRLNIAVTLLYIPLTFLVFLINLLQPKNRRAKRQSVLFLLATGTGLLSTIIMFVFKVPLPFIPSIFVYVLFIYLSMHFYRLALDAPSFVKDRLWDLVHEELILTDSMGNIVSWNKKAENRYILVTERKKTITSLFINAENLPDLLNFTKDTKDSSEHSYFQVAGSPGEIVSLTTRKINDAFGDCLGFAFISSGSVPFQTFKNAYSITTKEWEVIGLLAMGKEYRDIGELLFISPFTVKNHVHSIYQKMNIKNRFELVPLLFPQ